MSKLCFLLKDQKEGKKTKEKQNKTKKSKKRKKEIDCLNRKCFVFVHFAMNFFVTKYDQNFDFYLRGNGR